MKKIIFYPYFLFNFFNFCLAQQNYRSIYENLNCDLQINDTNYILVITDFNNKVFRFSEGTVTKNLDTIYLSSNPLFDNKIVNYFYNLELQLNDSLKDTSYFMPILSNLTANSGGCAISFSPDFKKKYNVNKYGLAAIPKADLFGKKVFFIRFAINSVLNVI